MYEARFQRVDEKPPVFLFLLQSLTQATDVAKDHGTIYPKKKVFKTLFRIRWWQTLTSLSKIFLSFNLQVLLCLLTQKRLG